MRTYLLAIILLMTISTPAYPFSMEEAVMLALESNHRLKEYSHKERARGLDLKSRKTEFLPDLDVTYSYTSLDEASAYQTKESSVLSVEAKYNLFNGFIDVNNTREARALLSAASYEKKSVEADIVLAVKTAYIELLRSKRNLAVSDETVTLLEKERENAGLYFREGMIAKNELLKVEVELASARLTRLQQESALTIATERLEKVTGEKIDDLSKLSDLLDKSDPPVKHDEPHAYDVEYSINDRSEVRYLNALRDAKRFEVKSIRGNYLPTIDLSIKQSSFGDSATPSGLPGDDDETRGVISAEWKLFETAKKRYDKGAAEADLKSIEEAIAELEEEISLQLKTAIEYRRLAIGKLAVAEKAITQAEENYRITENQFRQQIATATDILIAATALSRAKNDYNNARYDLHAAMARIERVTEGYSPP